MICFVKINSRGFLFKRFGSLDRTGAILGIGGIAFVWSKWHEGISCEADVSLRQKRCAMDLAIAEWKAQRGIRKILRRRVSRYRKDNLRLFAKVLTSDAAEDGNVLGLWRHPY